MSGRANKSAKPVVVVTKTKRPDKKQLVAAIILGVAILICCVVVALALYRSHSGNRGASDTATPAADKHAEVLRQATAADQRGDFAAEARQLQAYIDSNPPAQYSETEVIRLATAYQNAKQYDEALRWYQVAIDKYPGSKLAGTRGIAYVYMAKGDNQKAIEYFQKTITIEQSDPSTVYLVQNEQNNIRYIQGQIR